MYLASLIICTRNPRREYLEMTLTALRKQALPTERWELVIVDNASDPELKWDLSWHPHARVVREAEVGLSHARRRGVEACSGRLIVFVDDDNELAPSYLQDACDLFSTDERIAAAGGPSEGVWEDRPSWVERYQGLLAIGHQTATDPARAQDVVGLWGAGLVVRRVALDHVYKAGFHPRFKGRVGHSLVGCEDSEWCLALRLCGWKLRFDPRLRIRHHMPRSRATETYIRRLAAGFAEGDVVLQEYRDAIQLIEQPDLPTASW
ncbi:MAG TPA: glycosyltransferase, partial [Fimbriimonadaceae bacterium]|nr:glycosyltransferase [Fimbriimonadaceae bacterium]